MERRTLGRDGPQVSAMAFGAWAIGGWSWGGNDRDASMGALKACLEVGMSTIDTAPVYGFGLSERLVGEAIKGRRSKYEILTKAGLRWDLQKGVHHFSTTDVDGSPLEVYKYAGAESIVEECERSLQRLGTDYLDLYQIHWPDELTPLHETMEALLSLQQSGKIRAAGVSNYSLEQMKEASSVLKLVSNQLPYSMVRRDIEADLLPWCMDNGCSVLAYSPLQRGLLTGKFRHRADFAQGDSRPFTPYYRKENIARTHAFLDGLRPLAADKGCSLAQLVLSWTMDRPGITVVLAGARNEDQLKHNALAAELRLSEEERMFIDLRLGDLDLLMD